MVKMVETKTVTGELSYERDENDEYDRWVLFGKVEWNGIEADVKAYLDDVLDEFDGSIVKITIEKVEQ